MFRFFGRGVGGSVCVFFCDSVYVLAVLVEEQGSILTVL